MDNSDLSEPQKDLKRSPDDIPEALRDLPDSQSRSRSRLVYILIGGLLGLGAIAGALLLYVTSTPPRNTASVPTPAPVISPSPVTSPSTTKVNTPPKDLEKLLGHFAYAEAPLQELQPIAASHIKLRKPAAQEFQAMVRAARASGVILVPISGFRSIQEQQHVYFDIQAQRGQTVTKRAEVSAPPGYSEHHTGYAVDIGDGATPATNLNPNFDKTKAFEWLNANAARFHFEMSFPEDNAQGVSYEPWHWRFVGDRQSLETFYKARGKQE